VFGEVALPLARDMPFAKSIDFNGAVRSTDDSTSGGVTTWKAGLVWQPVDGLRLRAAQSRDIRAPTLISTPPRPPASIWNWVIDPRLAEGAVAVTLSTVEISDMITGWRHLEK